MSNSFMDCVLFCALCLVSKEQKEIEFLILNSKKGLKTIYENTKRVFLKKLDRVFD